MAEFKAVLDQLYTIGDDEKKMLETMRGFLYQGFDRKTILMNARRIIGDRQTFMEVVVAIAMRGPVKAASLKLSSGRTIRELGIPSSGFKGDSTKLTLTKIAAATADLAAWYLKQMNVKPRLKSDLPAWLQFPSAGSIKLPDRYRQLHIEFSIEFSKKIGGSFNRDIYDQMELNSYLNEKLNLF